MKLLPLKITILSLAMTAGLHAQTSSLLIKTGDQVKGISSNPATINSINWVTMNDLGGIAVQASVNEANQVTNQVNLTNISYSTNFVPWTNYVPTTNFVTVGNNQLKITATNIVPRTITNVTYQYSSVLVTNTVINFSGTVTNILYITNRWNVNGTTNTYVNKYAQILPFAGSPGTFTNIYNLPQGYRATTNTYSTNVTQYTYQTNTVVTNRPVMQPVLTNRAVLTPIATNVISTNRVTTNSSMYYSGIWASDTNGSLNLMIRSGQPSGISNSAINSFYNPVVNNNGAVAFIGYSYVTNSVTTTNGLLTNALSNITSIYFVQQGSTNPIRVASVGSPAPGFSDKFTSFGIIVLPDAGGVIFTGRAGTNQGFWVQNPDASVRLVAYQGQSLALGSTNKVVRSFNYSSLHGNYSKDTGDITYQAYFTDGTSAIIRVER